jgi:hypothetical protein
VSSSIGYQYCSRKILVLKNKFVADISLERFEIASGGTQRTYHAGPDINPAQFPLILDTIPVGITVVNLKGHIQFYNDFSSR